METIRNVKELNAAITLIENRQVQEGISLEDQFEATYESLKPINIVKNIYKDLVTTPDFKEDLFTASISMATGYISKKLAVGSTKNSYKQILGSIIQIGVTSVLSKNADSIKTKFMDIVSVFFEKKEE